MGNRRYAGKRFTRLFSPSMNNLVFGNKRRNHMVDNHFMKTNQPTALDLQLFKKVEGKAHFTLAN